jgi:hypothetical protein
MADVVALGINALNEIVGHSNAANDPVNPAWAFLRTNKGSINLFNPSDGSPPKTLAAGISNQGIVVGARRAFISELKDVRRRAIIGAFADVQVLPPPLIPVDLWTVLWPRWPFPFPPVWNAFSGGQNPPHEGHDAMVGLLMNELISSMTDEESRRRLRAEVLDMVLKEVRKLSDKEY